MRRKAPGAAILTAALILALRSPSETSAPVSGLNLLVITLDTTRADVIGLYGNKNNVSPNIDKLGQSGVVFKECYTPVPLTLPAHCSLFTGRYPIAHNVRNNGTYVLAEDELTMAEIFGEQGYQTAAVVSSFTVSSKFGLAQGFDTYYEDFESDRAILNFTAEIPADRIYEKFARWLDGRAGQKFFAWVHFYDPHAPYVSHGEAGDKTGLSPWSLYEGEVRFMDTYIGKLVEALRSKNSYENTVIVIVGDHGEAFGEHKEWGHGIFCYEESLRVPLIIHSPGVFNTPKTVTARVSLADIMPTLLELYKLKTPSLVQGRSFFKLIKDGGEKQKRTVYFESLFGQEEFNWAPLTGIIDGSQKFISLPEPELYDLDNDRRETLNLSGANPDASRALDKKLEQFIRQHAATKIASRRDLSQSDVEKLKALGYISSVSSKSGQMMDPKKAIDVYVEVTEIKDQLKQKNFRQAEERLAAVLSRNPGIELPDIYEISYEIMREKGKIRDSIEILEKAIGLFPERESFKVFLAMDHIEAGDLAEAREFCRGLLAENDQMTAAYILLGDVEDRLNNIDSALENYQRASALEPQNGMVKARCAGMLVKKGELAKAQAILAELEGQSAVTGSAEYMEAVSGLGQSLLAEGEAEKALQLYQRAAASNPNNPSVWLNLGSAYFSLRNFDLALKNFEKCLALDNNFALAQSNIGFVYLSRFAEENDPDLADRALRAFNRAIALQPELAAAYNGRASTRLATNQISQAIGDYERAIKLDPDLLDAYINISLALRQQGRYADALNYLDLCRERFYPRLEPRDREEIDRLYNSIKFLKDGR